MIFLHSKHGMADCCIISMCCYFAEHILSVRVFCECGFLQFAVQFF